MDDDDSQDELINTNTSHGRGKRAAMWAVSDDSDDAEEESDEGESNSSDEEDGEEEEDGNEEDDDEEEEEGEKLEGGAFGGTSADLKGMSSDEEEEEGEKLEGGAFGGTSADLEGMSSDEDSDRCPICLNSFSSQPVATPETCEHYFCLDCILEWTKNANSCPIDRIDFNSIYLRKSYGGKVKKVITIQKPVKEGQEEGVDLDLEQTNCEVCGGSDREDRLLLCDGCDAGYHMECLTPPLDSVPVEEWFCPECEANNRHSRGSPEELSDTDSLPSTAHQATRRYQAAGPTRAIARTQQSERVRANVNRYRITQARTLQSTWLDEAISAIIAGHNTSVYVRDVIPRATPRCRRKTRKRRKVKRKNMGKKNKVAGTGVKRKKRKVTRNRSRKKLGLRKTTTPRSRIANSLRIVTDKKSSSLPTVYRPSEQTLSGMRADIGAASLSICGDPFDLDPFVDHIDLTSEEEEQQAQVVSLLEAKRRGISHSALRSHQPVARPMSASLSRRAIDVPLSDGVVEAAPVPDLLGSILSGQSMLLMDSSDIVINRDGSLKAAKPIMASTLKPGCSKSSSSGDASTHFHPVMSPNRDGFPSSDHNEESSYSSSRPYSQRSHIPSPANSIQPSPQVQAHPKLQPPCPIRSAHPPGHRGINDLRAPCPSSATRPTLDSHSKSNGVASSHSQSKKAATKPSWVDVAVLPRIPKIKRESSRVTVDGSDGNTSIGVNSSPSSTSSHSYGMPEAGVHSFAGDKGRQQSVDQQKGRANGQNQRSRPDSAGSSSTFSNSFSSSSSSFPTSQSHYSSSSSSSSSTTVSFRINSSGNSWHSRRLSVGSSVGSGDSVQKPWKEKEDEAKRRQLHWDKQKLLESRTLNKEQDSNNIYDPFDPTKSDSSSSDEETESRRMDNSSKHTRRDKKVSSSGNKGCLVKSKQDPVDVKTETQELDISEKEPRRTSPQETISEEVRCSEEYVKVEKESRLVDNGTENQRSVFDIKVKEEPGLQNEEEAESFDDNVSNLNSETVDGVTSDHFSLDLLGSGRRTVKEEISCGGKPQTAPPENYPSLSTSAFIKKKDKADTKSESNLCSSSKDLEQVKQVCQASKEPHSSSPQTDRGRRVDHHSSDQGGKEKEKKKNRKQSPRSSMSRERRRAHSTSESSTSNSPDRSHRKRHQSRSRSKDRRHSRSSSSSSSREFLRRKKHKQRSKEQRDVRGRDCERRATKGKRHGRSRSKSRSKSRSRSRSRSKDHKRGRSLSMSRSSSQSRSRERRNDHALHHSSAPSRHKGELKSKSGRRHRSRSSSRDRRKEEGMSSKGSQKTSSSCVSALKALKQLVAKRKEDITQSTLKEDKVTAKKQDTPSLLTIPKDSKVLRTDNRATTAEMAKERTAVKEIKKEEPSSFDIFEDSPITKPVKTEETDIHALMVVKDEEGSKDFKTETCEISLIKSEPATVEICQLPPVTSLSPLTTPDSLQESVCPSQLLSVTCPEHANTSEFAVPVKQEVQQPSDSDDDFNIDVMLDNLHYGKSERTEECSKSDTQEKEAEEGPTEVGRLATAQGTKSKNQVKRVTWNIQEPDGPQPEKSPSKLTLYKLKLKQEGFRRPSAIGHTPSQGIIGAVSDQSKKSAAAPLSSSSRCDSAHPGSLSTSQQGEAKEEDVSRKDKYLKKLHMQERAIEEVKLAIKPFYQRRDINKDEYKEILRKAVQKVCHSKSGEINPVKVGNLVKAYVDKYKHTRKHKKGEDTGKTLDIQTEAMTISGTP